MTATIVYDQTTLWRGGFGKRDAVDDPAGGPPRASDLVRVASISKVFTDVLLYALRDAGVVGLDDDVADYVKGFETKHYGDTKEVVTLGALASHLSGLPREIPAADFTSADDPEADVLAALSTTYPVLPPNRRFHYSNLGVGLLGRAPRPRGNRPNRA